MRVRFPPGVRLVECRVLCHGIDSLQQ